MRVCGMIFIGLATGPMVLERTGENQTILASALGASPVLDHLLLIPGLHRIRYLPNTTVFYS